MIRLVVDGRLTSRGASGEPDVPLSNPVVQMVTGFVTRRLGMSLIRSQTSERSDRSLGVSWFGVSWFGVTWFSPAQLVAAVVVMLLALTALADPVRASNGNGNGNGNGNTGALQSCADMWGSTTLADVNAAIGADTSQNPAADTDTVLTGSGIDVAVIDTGVNALGVEQLIDGPDLSFDALEDNLRFRDLHGHGTNMAAIIANSGGNHDGVAPGSRIVNVKVGAANGAVDVSQVIAGIDWAVQNRNANGMNIRVINLAYDRDADVDYTTDPLTRAVENAWHSGIVVVVAGGNDGRGMFRLGNPAIDPYVIAVGASESSGNSWKVPAYSTSGDGVRDPDLVAPGSSILSIGVGGSYLAETHAWATCVDDDGLLYLRGSGTSQAAAVVSGAVAVLLEQRPDLAPDQVKALLTGTATDLDQHTILQGNGMLNLGAALSAATPSAADAAQTFTTASGTGSLEDSRGSAHVGDEGDQLTGEMTAFGGDFDSAAHAAAQDAGTTWTDQTWSGGTWSGGTWSGATWSGGTWSEIGRAHV